MRSIGVDLRQYVSNGLLRFHAARPTAYGLEMHVATMHKLVDQFKPSVVIIDPLSNLLTIGSDSEVRAALLRLIDYLKSRQITALFTSLTHDGAALEGTDVGVSSLMDTWLLLRDIESNGERNRGMYVLKSRGMAHSNQIREFRLTDHGIQLTNAYLGPAGVLTGTARETQEAKERADALEREQEIDRKQRDLQRKKKALEAQIGVLRAEFATEEEEMERLIDQAQNRESVIKSNRDVLARLRQSNGARNNGEEESSARKSPKARKAKGKRNNR